MADNDQATTTQSELPQQTVSLKRIYVKDVSFEAPNGPELFQQKYNPKVDLKLNCKNKFIKETYYEVMLNITAEATQDEKTLFLVEVVQAGIFEIKGLEGEELEHILASMCPSILFPYARETIDTLVLKGTFPPLMLDAVNFDAIYAQSLQQNTAQQEQQPS